VEFETSLRLPVEPHLELLRTSISRRAMEIIRPLAREVDRDQAFSPALWAAVCRLGLSRIPFHEDHGGEGGTIRAYIVASTTLAEHCAVAALYPGTSIQVAQALLKHGTREQINTYVPRLVAGDVIAAWAFTEPATGSDPRQISTTATRLDGRWMLNGCKQFISYAHQADLALVFARTSETTLGAFLVETTSPGWSVGVPCEVLSMGGTEARPVYLDNVPAVGGVVGPPESGFDIMLSGEAFGKLRAAAISVGVARRALQEARGYGLAREHRGVAIVRKFPALQSLLGRAGAHVLAADALVLACADLVDGGRQIPAEAASARLVAAQAAREAAAAALHVCGAYGLTREMDVERLYREAVFYDVAQGVAEIQESIVGRELLAGT